MADRVESNPGTGAGSDYLAARQLKAGSASWVLLAGLGVAYVISGDYAGWHFGLAQGGWGGLAIAAVLMAVMYACMVLGLAEMSSALPAAGGGYTFARVAMGPWGGFATGAAILLEYAVAPAAIATFIGGYVESLGLFGITDGWWVYLACYVLFIGIHLLGVGEALKVTFVITAIALAGLVLFALGAIGSFDTANLTDIPAGDAVGASPFLPFGLVGVWASFPFAIWFFLAVEGVPLAAEEARDPVRAVPRGIIVAMGVLAVSAAAVLFLAPGAQGSLGLSTSDNPLVSALEAGSGGSTWLSTTVNYIGLLGLIASFFSIIYAYSRQTFALSRAGYLPRVLSRTNGRKAPTLALIVPGAIGFVLAATGNGDILHQPRGVRGDAVLRADDGGAPGPARPRTPTCPGPTGRRAGGSPRASRWCWRSPPSWRRSWSTSSRRSARSAPSPCSWPTSGSTHATTSSRRRPDEEFAALAAAEEEIG